MNQDHTGVVNNPNSGNNDNPNAHREALHPKVIDKELLKNSGKETGLVDPNIVSVAPATNKKAKWGQDDYKIINEVSVLKGEDDRDEEYPFEKLEMGQGFFIPTQPNNTTDNLLAKMNKTIHRIKQNYGQIEVDEKGNDVWESIIVKTKKRNEDGTIQLNNGSPITGADHTNRPKYNYTRNFLAKPVVQGQELGGGEKAESDGVIIVRIA